MHMSPESNSLLKRLERDLNPPVGAKERIWKRIESRCAVHGAHSLDVVRDTLQPDREAKARIWARVVQAIDTTRSVVLLEKIKDLLTPPAHLRRHLEQRFIPLRRAVPIEQRAVKWVAAFVVFALFMKAGPQLLIAPRTVAEGAVTLMPTRGEVTVSLGGLWQPVDEEIRVEPGTLLRTHQGEASILFRDDGVVRLDEWTTVQVNDTSDPADQEATSETTLTLITGRIWVQGLIPAPLRGINVRTDFGLVGVQEGSVSIEEEEDVTVEVWDRRARVHQGEDEVFLVAGERTRLTEDGVLVVMQISQERYDDPWVVQNFKRDAVHRRYIAQLQQERRAARARILPTSPFYPVKRIAETVDMLLTFGEEARAQKQLEQASTRLDEASALLAEGDVQAVQIPLEEYRDSLLTLATGSGNQLVQLLIARSVAQQAGDVAAVLPGDEAYLIKRAVLEAGAQLSQGVVSLADVQGVLLLDTATALLQELDREGIEGVGDAWTDLEEHLAILKDDAAALRPEVRKEARVLLSEFAFALSEAEGVDSVLLAQVQEYLPPEQEIIPVLSDEEVDTIVQGIRDRIFVYHMKRSRLNQLIAEFKALEGHPDQGRILRQLRFALPDGPEEFPLRVRKEIIRLQWARAAG